MRVVIVDYGMGNVFSVARALQFCGHTTELTANDASIQSADAVILPGVGAIGAAMLELKQRGLDASLCRFAERERPLLGICLGMQALATMSEEFGTHACLNLIPGQIKKIQPEHDGMKVPNIGWYGMHGSPVQGWQGTRFDGLAENAETYFVHSYQFIPDNAADAIACYRWGNQSITAAVQRNNILGTQFHPEKSGPVGLKLLEHFFR